MFGSHERWAMQAVQLRPCWNARVRLGGRSTRCVDPRHAAPLEKDDFDLLHAWTAKT